VLLWLWCRLVAAAPIPSLAQESPYAVGLAIKRKKRKKERGREGERKEGRKKEKEINGIL